MGERGWMVQRGMEWVEVVPASALKRCEEERKEWQQVAMNEGANKNREYNKRLSAEAKCERLEAERDELATRLAESGWIASTPKTECRCELCGGTRDEPADVAVDFGIQGEGRPDIAPCADPFHSPKTEGER